MTRTLIKLSDLKLLNNLNCKIKNPSHVEHVLNQFVSGGTGRLQIVSDFDFTITKQRMDNGEKVVSSFGLLDECESLPDHFRQKSKELLKKYRPIEIDPHIGRAEKTKAMIEWWMLSSDILKGFSLTTDEIESVAGRYRNSTRDGSKELFDELNRLNVPVLVFSAGLGDSVKAMLKISDLLLPNVKVVSNFLRYKEGLLDGFDTDNMIHVFNKNESALKGSKEYDLVHDRNNIIVMGDSLGDSEMGNGCVNGRDAHILKIGFLFGQVELNLTSYMDAFDIVLLDDQTMDVPRSIVNLIHAL